MIERFVERRDQRCELEHAARELERWRPAASLAAEIYLDDHLRIDEEFEAKLAPVLAEHGISPPGNDPYSPAEYRIKFAMLAEREPAPCQSIAEWLWQGYEDIGRTILSVMPTVALYPPRRSTCATSRGCAASATGSTGSTRSRWTSRRSPAARTCRPGTSAASFRLARAAAGSRRAWRNR